MDYIWKKAGFLFGDKTSGNFPLLVKIIDAKEDLSIQVHPKDEDIQDSDSFGKTECWYILDCSEDGELVLGHNANSKTELSEMIRDGKWKSLLRRVNIKPGDFHYIPAGTVHAICKNTLILEVQQSSDITYRLYDYDRLDNGKPRELHIENSIKVIDVPYEDMAINRYSRKLENGCVETLVQSKYFTVRKVNINGAEVLNNEGTFVLVSVIEGQGYIDGYEIKKGDHFIIPYGYEDFCIGGEITMIMTYAPQN